MRIASWNPKIEIPEGFWLVVDTREQSPLFQAEPYVVRKALETGDYSVVGLEKVVFIERKNKEDLLSTLGKGRARWEREVERAREYWWKGLVIEVDEKTLFTPSLHSSLHPNSLYASLCSLEADHWHIYYAPTIEHARWWVLSRLVKLFQRLRQGRLEKVEGI